MQKVITGSIVRNSCLYRTKQNHVQVSFRLVWKFRDMLFEFFEAWVECYSDFWYLYSWLNQSTVIFSHDFFRYIFIELYSAYLLYLNQISLLEFCASFYAGIYYICWRRRHMIKKKSKESFIAFKEALKYKYNFSPWFNHALMHTPGPLFTNTLFIALLWPTNCFGDRRDSWQMWENYSHVALDVGNIGQVIILPMQFGLEVLLS